MLPINVVCQEQIDGEFRQYFSNGQEHIICNYEQGQLHGEFTKYFPNGQIKTICNYHQGILTGPHVTFWFGINEDLRCFKLYDKGVLVSIQKYPSSKK